MGTRLWRPRRASGAETETHSEGGARCWDCERRRQWAAAIGGRRQRAAAAKRDAHQLKASREGRSFVVPIVAHDSRGRE